MADRWFVHSGKGGKWFFHRQAANNEVVGSSEGYERLGGAYDEALREAGDPALVWIEGETQADRDRRLQMSKVKIEYVHHTGEHKPGDTESVEEALAAQLVDAGVAKITGSPQSPEKK